MMKAIPLLALFILLTATRAVLAADEAAMLTIRPEHLHSEQTEAAGADLSLRDPFNWPADRLVKPSPEKVEQMPDAFAALALEGIVWSAEQPLAIVNGKLVGKGDKVEGVTVKEIEKESIVLTSEGKSRTLRLLPPLPEAGGVVKGEE